MDEESFSAEMPGEVVLRVYHYNEPTGKTKYIYLIDMDKYQDWGFHPRSPSIIVFTIWLKSLLSLLNPFDDYPYASAFLYSDMSTNINLDTYLASIQCVPTLNPFIKNKDHRTEDGNPNNIRTTVIPGFCITGSDGDRINDGDIVKFTMIPEWIQDVVSYNVIGKIDSSSEKVVIVSAHYDGFWAQGAIDNGAAVAAIFGVAKYIKDHPNITPIYDIKFIAFGGEEYMDRGADYYVWKHIVKDEDEKGKIVAVINLDPIAMNTKMLGYVEPPIPLRPWIHPFKLFDLSSFIKYFEILSIINLFHYNNTTGYPISFPRQHGKFGQSPGGDIHSFRPLPNESEALANWLIELERYDSLPSKKVKSPVFAAHWNNLSFFDHRSGNTFTTGDILSKVDYDDLYETTKIALRLVDYFSFDPNLNFNNDCGFTQLDLDNDGQYDSVCINFAFNSNITSGGKIESIIYLNGQPQTNNFTTGCLSIDENETVYGNLIVTLPYNCTAGNCDIRVYLKDYQGDDEDFDNTTLYLYPYNHSVASYAWEINDINLKMVNFTDCSTPSPGGVINYWNWSFGDGYYSNQRNCSHNFSSVGVFNVTLTVTDNMNKSANVTNQIETSNTPPVALFDVSSNLVLVNNSVSFNSSSFDVDGSIVNATWYFGDGASGYGDNISHSYNKSGYYMVSLFATDNDDSTVRLTKTDHVLVVDALVDDDFIDDPDAHEWNSIQEGINDIGDNGTIYVYNGKYQPYLVNKSISIYGESKDEVQFELSQFDIGINIQSHDVFVKNFTITKGGWIGVNIISTVNGTGNTIIENGAILGPITYGVYIDNSINNTIKDCSVEKANAGIKICNGARYNIVDDCVIKGCYNGIGIYSSSYNWVGNPSIYDWYPNNCKFSLNTNAVYIDESDHNYILGCEIDATPSTPETSTKGIYLDESSNTTISTCKIFNSTHQGIYIKDSRDSKVEFCFIVDNNNGIECFGDDALYNLIVQNNISGNSNYGVYIPPFSQGNKVFYNDFLDNGNVSKNQSYDDGPPIFGESNKWCKEGGLLLTKKGSGEGNYWDDYTGSDLNQDGIGDVEYGIDGLSNEDDDYPLMETYGWCTGTNWE